MSEIGPVALDEARDVLADRLLLLESEPPSTLRPRVRRRPAAGARPDVPRRLRPGLAERMFPQKPREDPMMLDDEMRVPLGAGPRRCSTTARAGRAPAAAPRGRLRRPSGCGCRIRASRSAESRPRVPSFYALDVMRAITGRIPNHEELQERAAFEGGAGLAWPAPADPARGDRRSRARSRGAARAARRSTAARRCAATRTTCCS